MPVFEYVGNTIKGKTIKGNVEASSSKDARHKLKRQGLLITSMKEKYHAAKALGDKKTKFGKKVNINELSLITRQLATLVKANVPLVESFQALVDQTDNATLKNVLGDVKTRINEGQSTAQALGAYPKVFDSVYVNMVEAGEASGTLPIVLTRLADFSESSARLQSKVRGAMIYPVVMILIGIAALVTMMTVAVPQIAQMFADRGSTLPLITRIVMMASDILINYWYLLLGTTVITIMMLKRWVGTKAGKKTFDRLALRTPIFGRLVQMSNVARFCSVLSTLLSSGVPLLNALSIVKNLITNVHIQRAVEEAAISVKEGESLAAPLLRSGEFPPIVTHMVAIGEKSGELEQLLTVISESYEGQVSDQVDGMTKLLEPLMILGLGVAIGTIVIAIFLPLLDMMDMAQ